jgi:hypothetical protein
LRRRLRFTTPHPARAGWCPVPTGSREKRRSRSTLFPGERVRDVETPTLSQGGEGKGLETQALSLGERVSRLVGTGEGSLHLCCAAIYNLTFCVRSRSTSTSLQRLGRRASPRSRGQCRVQAGMYDVIPSRILQSADPAPATPWVRGEGGKKHVVFECAGYRLTRFRGNHGVLFGRHALENKSHEPTAVAVVDALVDIYISVVLVTLLLEIIGNGVSL